LKMNIIDDIKLYGKWRAIVKAYNSWKEDKEMVNWKTTLFGLLGVLPQVWQVMAPNMHLPAALANLVTAVMAAIAFYYAKDKNVTGGTTPQ
jgi:hypothetical protein